MSSVTFPPSSIFPEYSKVGGKRGYGDNNDNEDSVKVTSGDSTLIASVVEAYEDNDSYSDYEQFLKTSSFPNPD